MFLENSQNSQENTYASVSFLINLHASAQVQTLVQMFSCEFYEISKNTFFKEHLRATASVKRKLHADIRLACIVHSKFPWNYRN